VTSADEALTIEARLTAFCSAEARLTAFCSAEALSIEARLTAFCSEMSCNCCFLHSELITCWILRKSRSFAATVGCCDDLRCLLRFFKFFFFNFLIGVGGEDERGAFSRDLTVAAAGRRFLLLDFVFFDGEDEREAFEDSTFARDSEGGVTGQVRCSYGSCWCVVRFGVSFCISLHRSNINLASRVAGCNSRCFFFLQRRMNISTDSFTTFPASDIGFNRFGSDDLRRCPFFFFDMGGEDSEDLSISGVFSRDGGVEVSEL